MRGTPQKRLMLFDFRIRDKLRNSQGARCYRARIVKLFRPPGVYVCASSRTARNERDFRPLDDGRAATRSMTRETSHGNLAFAQRAGIFSVGKKTRGARERGILSECFASGLKMASHSSDPFFTLSPIIPRF